MEIDLAELDLYEKQLAERRLLQQQQQTIQADKHGCCSSAIAPAAVTTMAPSNLSQNVDEIDAYLDQLALDLQAKDARTNDTLPAATTSNYNDHHENNAMPSDSQCKRLVNNGNDASRNDNKNDDCDSNTACVNSSKTTLPLLIYAFLSILAYINTIRCKHTRFQFVFQN